VRGVRENGPEFQIMLAELRYSALPALRYSQESGKEDLTEL
jgi:hypothetical protein